MTLRRLFTVGASLVSLCVGAEAKTFQLQDVTDALQCAAGKIASRIGPSHILDKFSTVKFTITFQQESTNETEVKAGLVNNVFVLFPSASADWKSTRVKKQTFADKFSFRRNLHEANTAACNRRSNFDTGVVEDIITQLQLIDPSVADTTNIAASSQLSVTNNATLAASLGIPLVNISGSYGHTSLRTLAISAVSP